MNTFSSSLASVITAALIAPAFASSDQGVLAEYFPSGTLISGCVVMPEFDRDIETFVAEINKRLFALPEEERLNAMGSWTPGEPINYDERLWKDKDEYDRYMAAWDKRRIKETEVVIIGMNKTDEPKIWQINSGIVDPRTQMLMTLRLSVMKYNAKDNEWTSGNGTLKLKKKVDRPKQYVFGAMKGEEWSLEKEDALSKTQESLSITKSSDGKHIYVFYAFMEVSTATNGILEKGEFILRFPAKVKSTVTASEKVKKKPKK